MFTGIIEEIGTIKKLQKGNKSVALSIDANKVLKDAKIGDSIATNGVCLTVTDMTKSQFTVDVMYETLNRTNLQALDIGNKVNLERALTLSTRLGGHMVSGHIDGIGKIDAITKVDIAHVYTIKTSKELLKYIIEKGSVAVDGISLTVVSVDDDKFQISLIPHTKEETTLFKKRVSDTVNIECDLIGKYVEKLLNSRDKEKGISEDLLKKYGF